MERLTSDLQRPRDRMLDSHPESQLTLGRRLRAEYQGPKELSQKKEMPPPRRDGKNNPCADGVGRAEKRWSFQFLREDC
jgi:hypothetical protein